MGGSSTTGNNGGSNVRKNNLTPSIPTNKKNKKSFFETARQFSPVYQIISGLDRLDKHFQSKNKKTSGGDVYGGAAYGYNEKAEKIDSKNRSPNIYEGGINEPPKKKSIEQPKVASQTNALKPDIIPKGPTTVEINQTEDDVLKNKRKGRKSTILTSVTGVTTPATLSKKTLLG